MQKRRAPPRTFVEMQLLRKSRGREWRSLAISIAITGLSIGTFWGIWKLRTDLAQPTFALANAAASDAGSPYGGIGGAAAAEETRPAAKTTARLSGDSAQDNAPASVMTVAEAPVSTASQKPVEPTREIAPAPETVAKPTAQPLQMAMNVAPPSQVQTPPAPLAAPSAPGSRLDIAATEQQDLMVRVAAMIRQGDIAGARVILSRLERAGNSRAVFALAQTYDPQMLNQWNVYGIKPDLEKATDLYRRAADEGIGAAKERLAAINLRQ